MVTSADNQTVKPQDLIGRTVRIKSYEEIAKTFDRTVFSSTNGRYFSQKMMIDYCTKERPVKTKITEYVGKHERDLSFHLEGVPFVWNIAWLDFISEPILISSWYPRSEEDPLYVVMNVPCTKL